LPVANSVKSPMQTHATKLLKAEILFDKTLPSHQVKCRYAYFLSFIKPYLISTIFCVFKIYNKSGSTFLNTAIKVALRQLPKRTHTKAGVLS